MDWPRTSVALERFERLAEMQLKEIHQHTIQIEQGTSSGNVRSVANEETNAKRTVHQLLQGLRQILALRGELPPVDQERFDERIEPIRRRIQRTVNELNVLCSATRSATISKQQQEDNRSQMGASTLGTASSSSSSSPFSHFTDAGTGSTIEPPRRTTNYFDDNDDYSEPSQQQLGGNVYDRQLNSTVQISNTRTEELRLRALQAKEEAEAHTKLAHEIDELNVIMIEMAGMVQAQHETVDSIEEHVESAERELHRADRDLKKAARYNSAKAPMAAAAVGAVAAGGPIGLAAGSGIAAVVAAVGGAIAGAYGGKLLRRQAKADTEFSGGAQTEEQTASSGWRLFS